MAKSRSLITANLVFAIVTTLFFLAMLLRLGIGLDTSLILTAAWGTFTGLLLMMGYGYRETLQRRAFQGKKQAGATTDSYQERTIEIDLPFEAAFDMALEALKTLDNQRMPMPDDPLVRLEMLVPRGQKLRIYKADRVMGSIRAGLRTHTLGITDVVDFSHLAIQLQRVDAETTRIHIEGKPATLFGEYDLGKNLHYVNHLALYLRRESQHINSAAGRLRETDAVDVDHDHHVEDAADTDTNTGQLD